MSTTASPFLTESELRQLLTGLPKEHRLASVGDSYREGFLRAFLRVHGQEKTARKRLQESFFVPWSPNYTNKMFVEHASELSVAHHIALQSPDEFDTDRVLDPAQSDRDVDVFYRFGTVQVHLEVKCPDEMLQNPNQPTLAFAGRHPDPKGIFEELRQVLAGAQNLPEPMKDLQRGPHYDNKLKDYLVLAHGKFTDVADLDQLNVLFVAAGEELQPWVHYLYEPQGLFTPQSFWPVMEFDRTQVVMLSNLRYCHTKAAAHHDWTLSNVFLLPFINPYAARVAVSETRDRGLSVFDHHFAAYQAFDPGCADPRVPAEAIRAGKLNHYIHGAIGAEEFARYFPCTHRRGPKVGVPPAPVI